jgi:BMFP domain-containing protein YqiC
MFNPQHLDGIVKQVLEAIPAEVGQAPEQLKAQLKAKIQQALHDMDLVTREEFEIQQQVLAKTRAKVDALAAKLAAFEQANQAANPSGDQSV